MHDSVRPWLSPRTRRWLLICILALGSALRLIGVQRPLDERLTSAWRESDATQIARNFHREGMDIRYPRVDWRGDTPGYVEMEFPLLPWLTGGLYHVFGERVQIYRSLTALLQIVGLWLFALLAWRMLAPSAAVFATALYALNQTLIELAISLQPEPLMLVLLLGGAHMLWTWEQDEDTQFRWLYLACVFTGAAILAKATAIHFGFLIAFAVLRKLGRRALWEPRVYVAAGIALLPGLAWYAWARHFWVTYGLSLGLSNETHFLGIDMLWPPSFLGGIFRLEISRVFTPLGWLLALAALPRLSRNRVAIAWYLAVVMYYLVTARTSGDGWAYYYHSMAVAPGCLLMAGGLDWLLTEATQGRPRLGWAGAVKTAAQLVAALTLASQIALGIRATVHQRERWQADLQDLYACTRQFEPLVPTDGRLVIPGGSRFDEYGMPVAYNRPMVFAWMDRKGFSYAEEDRSIPTLEGIAARGGRYWMPHDNDIEALGRQAIVERFSILAECERGYALIDLTR